MTKFEAKRLAYGAAADALCLAALLEVRAEVRAELERIRVAMAGVCAALAESSPSPSAGHGPREPKRPRQ